MSESRSEDFMIAEFNAIQQRVIQIEQSVATVTNLYLIIVAASLAVLSGFLQNSLDSSRTIMLIIVLFTILIAGFITYEYAFHQSVIITIFFRRAGRIRRWFAIQDPSIRHFLPFEYTDDRPPMPWRARGLRGSEAFAFNLNIIVAGTLAGVLFISAPLGIAAFAAIISGISTWALQKTYTARRLKEAEIDIRRFIQFPSERESFGKVSAKN